MRNARRKLSILIVSILTIIATSWTLLGVPAFASSQDICGNGGTGYCLNDWNGLGYGHAIDMYYGGYSNEDFTAIWLDQMCNGGFATSTCPIDVSGLNLSGGYIIELDYNGSGPADGDCIVTSGTALAVFGTCAGPNGSGGSNGVIMVEYHINGVTDPYLADRYWTNQDGQVVSLTSGGNPGQQAFFEIGATTGWGGSDLANPLP